MSLPPGFRFHPTDVELIMYYLKRKVLGKKFRFEAISELNIYKSSPWDLPDKSCLKSKDLEWYFFCPRERKYASGSRMNRATETGYWKTTGKDRAILHNENNVGMVKTLVFHRGAPPNGERTDWVIHEYRIQDKQLADAGIAQDSYVLCKVFKKNGPGPKNGAQYGAPFKEEEWDDDVQNCCESLPFGGPSTGGATMGLGVPENPSCSVVTTKGCPETASSLSLPGPGPSTSGATMGLGVTENQSCSVVTAKGCPETASSLSLPGPGPSSDEAPTDVVLPGIPDDDILQFLASFTENSSPPPPDHMAINEMLDNHYHERNITTAPGPDGNGFYHNVGELGNWPELGDGGINFGAIQGAGYALNSMPYTDGFLELDDLAMPLNSSVLANVSELVPTSNLSGTYNTYGNLEGINHGGNPFGMNPYYSGLSELMPLPESSGAVGFTDMLQGNGNGSYTNQAYNAAAYIMNFTTPDARRGIEHGSDGTDINQVYNAAYNMPFAEPNEYSGINQGHTRGRFQNFQ